MRRTVAFAVFGLAFAPVGSTPSTWGAAPDSPVVARTTREVSIESASANDAARDDRSETAVVLVVLDGVRWQDVFGGPDPDLARAHGMSADVAGPRSLMPHLYALLDRRAVALGAPGHGPGVSATGPQFISLPGYLEIFAGHPDPGCLRNDCDRPPARTIVDDVVDASDRRDAAVITSWPNIARASSAEPSRFVVSAGRSRVEGGDLLLADPETAARVDEGAHARAFPGEGNYRPDALTAPVALRYLETAQPRFLFVGLGDADEYAHRDDYRRYLDAIHAADAFLGDVVSTLDRMGARGRHTTVIVTADHGRARDFRDHGARYPESGRVWLAAVGDDLRTHGIVDARRRYTLSDIAPTVRALLGVPNDSGSPIAEIVP